MMPRMKTPVAEGNTDAGPAIDKPICLRGMGSFHIGGKVMYLDHGEPRMIQLTRTGQPANFDPNGSYFVGQMYVQYFLPQPLQHPHPLLMWHGGGLTGACWETTPDGRPGFREIFLRQGWDVYVSDAVERGRSGFAPVPEVWGMPVSQTVETVFERFRFGPKLPLGALADGRTHAFETTAFPVEELESFAAQMVPRWTDTDDLILDAYLAQLEETGPAVIMAHSQGCVFAIEAALKRPDLVVALVLLEPAAIAAAAFSARTWPHPTLIVLGDHIDQSMRWTRIREDIKSFAGCFPSIEVLTLPDEGLRGNSHMLMMDRSSAEVAERIDAWLSNPDRGC